MNPSTSLGTRSNVGMAKPSPPVRQAGNIGRRLMIRGVCRRKVPSGGAQVKSKCRCRVSTDVDLDALAMYRYDKARFQIEFVFRDADQFTGLTDCQAR